MYTHYMRCTMDCGINRFLEPKLEFWHGLMEESSPVDKLHRHSIPTILVVEISLMTIKIIRKNN